MSYYHENDKTEKIEMRVSKKEKGSIKEAAARWWKAKGRWGTPKVSEYMLMLHAEFDKLYAETKKMDAAGAFDPVGH